MHALVLILALALDRWVGEYPNRWHPVVWIGTVIRAAEARAPVRGQFVYGLGMALLIPLLFAAVGWGVSRVPVLDVIGGALLLKGCFAIRALGRAGAVVADAVEADDLAGAREGLRSLCSRDPSTLVFPELIAGATESLAENASDSIVAPLFWYALLGLPGIVFYRAANTMDSMIGYHGRYEWLGKAAARLDDALNLVPARLTALLLLVGGGLVGADVRGGWRVMRRDATKTESPNAGWPMAAMAGLLGVRLEKPGHYQLGDPQNTLGGGTIRQGWRIVSAALVAGALAWAVVVAARFLAGTERS
ncbi:MAG: adenosylcobinamide-phosphate synthase CbiB [Pseudomonadota bacterium]|nr:adenosylcobinamide-phosphate synthase CbiB [Pseudomonadota bacterium]